MKVAIIHNLYSGSLPSGENLSVAQHVDLMDGTDVEIHLLTVSNSDFVDRPFGGIVAAANGARRTGRTVDRWMRAIQDITPDVVHFENLVPLIPEAIVGHVLQAGVPVVRRWRNFRFRCLNGNAYRAGRSCSDCATRKRPLPGVLHGCYAQSHMASAIVATRSKSELRTRATFHVPNSEFVARSLIEAGAAEDRVRVMPNWVPDSLGLPRAHAEREPEILFLGTLTPKKGVVELLEAWKLLRGRRPRGLQLSFLGDGPLRDTVLRAAARDSSVRLDGLIDNSDARARIRGALGVVVPSAWEEPFGRIAVEAFAEGTPVVATRRGGLQEVLQCVPDSLVDCSSSAIASGLSSLYGMTAEDHDARSREVRERYERHFSAPVLRTRWVRLYADAVT